VIFEKARTLLRRLRAVSKSCCIMWVGESFVPAVSEPSQRMRVFWLCVATPICSQRSSRVVIRVCMWSRLGVPVVLAASVSRLYWRNRL